MRGIASSGYALLAMTVRAQVIASEFTSVAIPYMEHVISLFYIEYVVAANGFGKVALVAYEYYRAFVFD